MKIILDLDFSPNVTAKKRREVVEHIITSLVDVVDEFVTTACDETKLKGEVQYDLISQP